MRRASTMLSGCILGMLALALSGCGSDGHRAGSGPIPDAVVGRPFTVVSVDGVAVRNASFQLVGDGSISGQDGCNSYVSQYLWTPKDDGIEIDDSRGPRVETAVGCPADFKVVAEPYGRFEISTSAADRVVHLTIHRDDGRIEIATAPAG